MYTMFNKSTGKTLAFQFQMLEVRGGIDQLPIVSDCQPSVEPVRDPAESVPTEICTEVPVRGPAHRAEVGPVVQSTSALVLAFP